MNAKQWNAAMCSALIGLVVIAIPFFALAQDFGFGASSDFGFGASSDFGFGSSSDLGFGSDSDFGFGSAFSSFGFGGSGTTSSGATTDGSGSGSSGSTGSGSGILLTSSGFDPFDGDLGPFGSAPGNPQGTDTMPNPDPDGDGCIVNCNPGSTTPTPTPIPTGNPPSSSTGKDTLRIFIHQIFLHDPFDHLAGDQVPLRITFENDGTKNLDNTKVIATIPDLGGVRATVGPFDLNRGRTMTKTLVLELPEDVQPGTYAVRLQIYSETAQRIVHREVEIIDYS